MPDMLKFKSLVASSNEGGLYTKKELLPVILIKRQMMLYAMQTGKCVGSKKKRRVKSQQRLVRRSSTGNFNTKRKLTKDSAKRNKES